MPALASKLMKSKYVIALLAAGSSERLGIPKQLLPFRESNLLDYSWNECMNSIADDTYVILGHEYEAIKKAIDPTAKCLFNPHYKAGMGSSMSFAIRALKNKIEEAVIFCLSDQVFFNRSCINELIEQHQSGNSSIVASKYEISSGPPVLFSKGHFGQLDKLHSDQGARNILQIERHNLSFISFAKGHIDIDKPSDLFKIF